MFYPTLFRFLRSSYYNQLMGLHLRFEKHWGRCKVSDEHLGTEASAGDSEVGQKTNEKVLEDPWDWPLRKPNHYLPLPPSSSFSKLSSSRKPPRSASYSPPSPPSALQWLHAWCVDSPWLQRRAIQTRPLAPTHGAAWVICFMMSYGHSPWSPSSGLWGSPSWPYRFLYGGKWASPLTPQDSISRRSLLNTLN